MMFTPRTRRHTTLTVVVLICAALLAAIPVLGASGGDFAAEISCDGFTPNGASITADRDNTGRGQESIAINAVDGTGAVVFQLVDAIPLNWSVTPGSGVYGWSTAPAANPISMSIISLPGNGLPQETLYSTTGNCEGLPDGTAVDASDFTVASAVPVTSLTVSPSILPGREIPVPTVDAAAIEALPYYGIVNTPRLNMRSGDGPQYLPVAVLRGGTRLVLLARNDEASWWLVDVSGFRGWASAEFLAVRGDATDVPVLTDTEGDLIPVTIVTSIPQRTYTEANDLTVNFFCEIEPGEYVVVGKDRFDVFYEIEARCADGTIGNAWIRGDEGLFRNPAALSLPVTG